MNNINLKDLSNTIDLIFKNNHNPKIIGYKGIKCYISKGGKVKETASILSLRTANWEIVECYCSPGYNQAGYILGFTTYLYVDSEGDFNESFLCFDNWRIKIESFVLDIKNTEKHISIRIKGRDLLQNLNKFQELFPVFKECNTQEEVDAIINTHN